MLHIVIATTKAAHQIVQQLSQKFRCEMVTGAKH